MLAIGVVVVTGSAALVVAQGGRHQEVLSATTEASGNIEATGRPAITLETVEPGTSVFLDSAELKDSGFVVVTEDNNRLQGKVLGASELLTPGVHGNVEVKTSELANSQVIHVVLYKDNGDGIFAEGDAPVVDENGLGIEVVKNVGTLPMDHSF